MMMFSPNTVYLINLMEDEKTRSRIEKAMSSYPIYIKQSKEEFIPSYVPTREELNKKIINAYKYREIGFETVGRFIDELEISLNEIMPRYNLLFFSADQDFNVIFNVDYQKTIDVHRTGTESNTVNGSSTSKTGTETSGTDETSTSSQLQNDSKKVHSSTPQGVLNIPSKNIDSVNYADDVEWNQTSGSDSGTSTGKTSGSSSSESSGSSESSMNGENEGTESTLETIKGNFGVVSAQDLILKYRETILNIEQMIINDERISELFLRVF